MNMKKSFKNLQEITLKVCMAFLCMDCGLGFDKRSGEIVGRAGIENREIDGVMRQELGYLIGSKWQGKDMATRLQKLSWITLLEILALINFFYVPIYTTNRPQHFAESSGFELFAGDVDGMDVYIIYGAKL